MSIATSAGVMSFVGSTVIKPNPIQVTQSQCLPSPTKAHHWDIETANGTTSDGKCRYCRTTRTFYNWFENRNPNNGSAGLRAMYELSDEGV